MKCEMDFVLINELFEIFAACIVSVVVKGSEALLHFLAFVHIYFNLFAKFVSFPPTVPHASGLNWSEPRGRPRDGLFT
jgi:hypothetical protein